MKKICFLLFTMFSLAIGIAKAQYPVLLFFNDTNGRGPTGSLILSGSTVYGLTERGGANGVGRIFSMNTNGNGYKNLHDFNTVNGELPHSSLTLLGNKLYGMAAGGANDIGCIFSIDTDGNGYKDILDFKGTSGAYPSGDLTLSGSVLYGMTAGGGANNDGVVFSVDTNGTGYKDLLDFNGTNGLEPYGSLVLSGGVLFGMTSQGGAQGDGVIFSIKTNGSQYKKLVDFNNINGSSPLGSLIISGDTLYGMTYSGGANNYGIVFSIDTDGSAYKKIFDFNGINGELPRGALTLVGRKLYGLTSQGGGIWPYGCMFQLNTDGSGYKKLLDFNGSNGTSPFGSVIYSTGVFYGMTQGGGLEIGNDGVVFEYMSFKDSIISISNACYGGTAGSASVIATGDDPSASPPYSYSWSPGGATSSTISGLSEGTYKVIIKDIITNDTLIDSVTITQPASPMLIKTNNQLSSCKNISGSASVSVSGGIQPYSYSWSPSGGTDSAANGLSVGYYTCIITDSLGCIRNEFFSIKDSGTLKATLLSYSNLKCYGDSGGRATAGVSGGTKPFTYQWYPYGGTDTIAQKLVAGTFTVTVTDSNGCKADTLVTITQPSSPIIISPYAFSDTGSCNGIAWIEATGGISPYSYSWAIGSTTDTIYNKCHGTYCFTITDANGCIDSSCAYINLDTSLSVNQLINNIQTLKVYPNPSNGKFTFQSSVVSQQSSVEVYNVLGQQVYSQLFIPIAIGTQFSIDLENQPAGIYFYRVLSDGKFVGSGKLVIEK